MYCGPGGRDVRGETVTRPMKKRVIIMFSIPIVFLGILAGFTLLFGITNSIVVSDQILSSRFFIRRVSLARGGFIVMSFDNSGNPNKFMIVSYMPRGVYENITFPFSPSMCKDCPPMYVPDSELPKPFNPTIIFKPGGPYQVKSGHKVTLELFANNNGFVTNIEGLPNYYPETIEQMRDVLGRPIKQTITFL